MTLQFACTKLKEHTKTKKKQLIFYHRIILICIIRGYNKYDNDVT